MKQEDALSPLLFNFALDNAIRMVQVNQDGLKLNGTEFLDYADEINVLGESVSTVRKNTYPLLVAHKETGLEVNTDKSKYVVISRDQNAGRIHRLKSDSISLERVEHLRYFGTNLTH